MKFSILQARLFKFQVLPRLTIDSKRLFSKKVVDIHTNFNFQDEFQKTVLENYKSSKTKVTSADLLKSSKSTKREQRPNFRRHVERNMYRQTSASLEYRGEILFGFHPVYLALRAQKRKFHRLFLRMMPDAEHIRTKDIELLAKDLRIPICSIDIKDMQLLVPGTVHQGVCLDAEPLTLSEWNAEESPISSEVPPLWLVLDGIVDPMNMGAILRSAYYFGVERLFTMRDNSCKLSPVVSKASSGALELMDIWQLHNLEHFIQLKKNHGWRIVSTLAYCEEAKTCSNPAIEASQYRVSQPTILILGNEGRGVRDPILNLCDTFISISPENEIHPGVDSLNVSVAAGVILHCLSRSR